MSEEKYFAVIRIRGGTKYNPKVRDTFRMLNLNNQHNMVFVPVTSNYIGMLRVVKDYVTWGEVSPEIMQKFKSTNKTDNNLDNKPGSKPVGSNKKIFRLKPPKGGYERKGIKISYTAGGALGYRKDKINELITKMM